MTRLPSPQEELPGRVIRAVHVRMTGRAGSREQPIAGRQETRVVDRARMTRADMASLAENGRLGDEHALVLRSVRVMTCDAPLTDRSVLPQERSALVGMTARAQPRNGIAGLQELHVGRTVRVVAARALHLAFANGHVAGSIELRNLVAVATRAGFHLGLALQHAGFGLVLVHAVAGRAGQTTRL